MSKDVECRYKTVDDMLDDLKNVNKQDYLYEKRIKMKRKIIFTIILTVFLIFIATIYYNLI